MKILSEILGIPRAWGSLSFQNYWKEENILEWLGSNLRSLFAFLGSRTCFPWQGASRICDEAQHFKKTISMAEFVRALHVCILSHQVTCVLGLMENFVNKKKRASR